ncbi:hypothetical protein LSH36_1g25004 [Paralvinella palmiformis]|uniref:Peptidase S1 domain-containing protein n=1 Tax=Paralvinella palmiformis TaxID=53620 RepID=A0AAD9NKQ8_9ANNE|nr:hypothetical protein LSH36_1g25004 [Paralvinella palmiformis]
MNTFLLVSLFCAAFTSQASGLKRPRGDGIKSVPEKDAQRERIRDQRLTTISIPGNVVDDRVKSKSPNDDDSTKIVNGVDASPGEFPHQAQLLYNGAHRCGGSLVHACYMLTAKHCVSGLDKADLTVRLGEHKRSDSDPFMTEHTVVVIIQHPYIDVALLIITPSADLANIRINTIPLASVTPSVGTNATVTGWGQTESMVSMTLADVLQKVSIPIADPDVCNADLPGIVHSDEICAGTETGMYKNACHGDSGGPLITSDGNGGVLQVGVVSWGNGGCPSNHHYAVYVNIAGVRPWIVDHLPSSTPSAGSDCQCVQPAVKPDGTPVPATYDGAHCYLGPAREGCNDEKQETKSFIYANRYYIKSSEATFCPVGLFDSCNCYIMAKPSGGFIYHNKFYQTLPSSGECPAGTSYDGANCFIMSAPWATTAFIYDNNFYTTARKTCAESTQFSFDGANCRYVKSPGPNPFIWNDAYYSDKSGGTCPTGSTWDGAHCYFQHAPWATSPFIWNGYFYTTFRKRCFQGEFDGANCLIMTPPEGATAFIYDNKYYYGW